MTAQPAHSSILKNLKESRNRNRRKRKGFQNFCKEMVKMKILAFVSRRPSQWAHMCTHADPAPPRWEEAHASEQLFFKMAPISQELAKDGRTICLGTDPRAQEGLKGAGVKPHRVTSFVVKPKKQSPVKYPFYILEILWILYSFMGI